VCRIADPSLNRSQWKQEMRKSATMTALDDGNVFVDHAAIAAINGSIVPINGNYEADSLFSLGVMHIRAARKWSSVPWRQRMWDRLESLCDELMRVPHCRSVF
jgi:hypothetical protein